MHVWFVFLMLLFTSLPMQVLAQEDVDSAEEASKDEEEREQKEQRKLDQALNNLGTTNYVPFESAVFFFERLGARSTPHLIKLLREERDDKRLRINAIYTLGRLGDGAVRSVPILIPFLREEDADYRATSAIALGKIGRGAKDAVSSLNKLLYDEDEWVVESALSALERIDTEEARLVLSEYQKLKQSQEKKAATPL